MDRLTIVAHGEYEKIVAIANDPNSLVHNIIPLDDRSGFGRPRQLLINTNYFDDAERILDSNNALNKAIDDGIITKEDAVSMTSQLSNIIRDVIKSEESEIQSSSELK